MIYRKFQDMSISALGMGAMRLPTGEDGKIDVASVEKMVDYAMERGINYYDTAWGYHNGESEPVMGRALSKYPRESYYLATKFPGYDLSNMPKVKEIFPAQLERCGVDYFDFYLFHNVCQTNIDYYLDPKYGIYDYLVEQKKNGRIKHLGFSFHGGMEELVRFLDAYGDMMEFGQLQINWIDWDFQNSRGKYEMLAEKGIPVIVMEPLRGGKLAAIAPEYDVRLAAIRPAEKTPAWAFRFLQRLPNVFVTLSGMSNFEQLRENIATYETDLPLDNAELETLFAIGRDMISKTAVPCTACRYCVDHCPMELDIPKLLAYYNEFTFTGGGFIAPMAIRALPEDKRPSACVGCRSCETLCPQGIKISEALADFASKL